MSNNINSKSEQYKRLVKAFSVQALKEVFNLTEYKERQMELINRIIETNDDKVIEETIFRNFSLLKQHVYVYNFIGALPTNYLQSHPYFKSIQVISGNHSIYNLLFPTKFEFYNKNKSNIETIEFLVPVQIHRKGTRLIVHINILERDIASIIQDKVVAVSRDTTDDTILNSFVESTIPHGVNLNKCDMNKGIKELWAEDEIDAFKAKYKKPKSVSTEVLDEDFMLKKDMNSVYLEIIKAPIVQTTFRVLKQRNLIDAFVVDPTKGIFYFSVFPKHHAGVTDLIDMILSKN